MKLPSQPCYTVAPADYAGFLWALKATERALLAIDRKALAGRVYSDGTNVIGTNRARMHVYTPQHPLPSGAYALVSKKPMRFVEIEDKLGVGQSAFRLFFSEMAKRMNSKQTFRLYTVHADEQTCLYRLLSAVFWDTPFNEEWVREALGPFPAQHIDLPFSVSMDSSAGSRIVDPALFVVRLGFALQMPLVQPFKPVLRVEA